MSWFDDELQAENLENYHNYKITQALKGNMTPSFEGVIRLINSRRKDHEKIQNQKRKSVTYNTDDSPGTDADHTAGTR